MGNYSYLLYMLRHANVNTSKLKARTLKYFFDDFGSDLLERQGETVSLWKIFLGIDGGKIFGYYGFTACDAFDDLNNAIEDITSDFSSVSMDPENQALAVSDGDLGERIPICLYTEKDEERIPLKKPLLDWMKEESHMLQEKQWGLSGVTVFMEQEAGYLFYINFPGPGCGVTRHGHIEKSNLPRPLEQKNIFLEALPAVMNSVEEIQRIFAYRCFHSEIESSSYNEDNTLGSVTTEEKRKRNRNKADYDAAFKTFCDVVPETFPLEIELSTGPIVFPIPCHNNEMFQLFLDYVVDEKVDSILTHLARCFGSVLSPSKIQWDSQSSFAKDRHLASFNPFWH